MKKDANRLNRLSYKFRALQDHPCHKASKTSRNKLADAIFKAKKEHWQNWLEEATESDVWTAHKYIKAPTGDGGRSRIPTLTGKADNGSPITATTNQEKGELLAKILFPPPPESSSVPADYNYPDPAENWTPITREHLVEAIRKLNAFKAPGPDGIANIVLKKCPVLIDRLLIIFNAAIQLDTYYDPWRESTTVVIRKPGKPDYSAPKAYRPIALLNTTAKLFSALIADRVSYILEKHNLLPSTHFGGWPGRSTTDSLHLLETTIRHAWRQGKVVSALFLDIEGAFPNAVTDRLLHNMRARRLPPEVVNYTQKLLQGRRTRLRFDDFNSDWIPITNGIGQGDPLSMILFIIYNSDLVETAANPNELTLAFVDDTAFIAIGKDFNETHAILVDMLEQEGGGYQWSRDHNSRFETSKFALIDFSLNRSKERPPIHVRGITIKPTKSHKFLGIILDQELRWQEQASYALGKGTEYTMLMRRVSGATWGTPSKLVRQLYQAVVIPRTTYAASVWLRPTYNRSLDSPQRGSIGIANKLGRTQRSAATTILGALRTSPLDSLEVHAFLLPAPLLIQDILYRSALRLARLPQTHPLHAKLRWIERHDVKRHKSALHNLVHTLKVKPSKIEKTTPNALHPGSSPLFIKSIASTDEEAIEDFKKNRDQTKIFTDGSSINGKVGASAVMYVNDTKVASLRYHLGAASKHTVFEAELVGMILAAHLLNVNDDLPLPASIFVDNQAAILAGERPTTKPGHYLSIRFREIIQEIHNRRGITKEDVSLCWIVGHRNITGNEEADKEAKEAATDKNSATPADHLPTALKAKLPFSTSALKQKHKADLLTSWRTTWNKSKRYGHLARIDDSAPSKKYLKATGFLPKSRSGVLFQLRSGHSAK